MGRLISLVLRMPAALPPTERLRWVTDEMAGIGGGRPLGFGANRVRQLPDGMAQVLAEHFSDLPRSARKKRTRAVGAAHRPSPSATSAPNVAKPAFLNVEGCRKCHVAATASAKVVR